MNVFCLNKNEVMLGYVSIAAKLCKKSLAYWNFSFKLKGKSQGFFFFIANIIYLENLFKSLCNKNKS